MLRPSESPHRTNRTPFLVSKHGLEVSTKFWISRTCLKMLKNVFFAEIGRKVWMDPIACTIGQLCQAVVTHRHLVVNGDIHLQVRGIAWRHATKKIYFVKTVLTFGRVLVAKPDRIVVEHAGFKLTITVRGFNSSKTAKIDDFRMKLIWAGTAKVLFLAVASRSFSPRQRSRAKWQLVRRQRLWSCRKSMLPNPSFKT